MVSMNSKYSSATMDRSVERNTTKSGVSNGALVGIIVGCVVAVGMIALVLFALYRKFCANSLLPHEEQFPTAEPPPQEVGNMQDVEGAVMVPVEDKSFFFNHHLSIALTLVHSNDGDENGGRGSDAESRRTDVGAFSDDEAARIVCSFSSHCAACLAAQRGLLALHHPPDGEAPADTLTATSNFVSSSSVAQPLVRPPFTNITRALEAETTLDSSEDGRDSSGPLRQRAQLPTAPASPVRPRTTPYTAFDGSEPDAVHRMHALDGDAREPFASEPSSPPPSQRQHHDHKCRRLTKPQSVTDEVGGTSFVPEYPSEKMDEKTHKRCQLYRRRRSDLVYGTGVYLKDLPSSPDS